MHWGIFLGVYWVENLEVCGDDATLVCCFVFSVVWWWKNRCKRHSQPCHEGRQSNLRKYDIRALVFKWGDGQQSEEGYTSRALHKLTMRILFNSCTYATTSCSWRLVEQIYEPIYKECKHSCNILNCQCMKWEKGHESHEWKCASHANMKHLLLVIQQPTTQNLSHDDQTQYNMLI